MASSLDSGLNVRWPRSDSGLSRMLSLPKPSPRWELRPCAACLRILSADGGSSPRERCDTCPDPARRRWPRRDEGTLRLSVVSPRCDLQDERVSPSLPASATRCSSLGDIATSDFCTDEPAVNRPGAGRADARGMRVASRCISSSSSYRCILSYSSSSAAFLAASASAALRRRFALQRR